MGAFRCPISPENAPPRSRPSHAESESRLDGLILSHCSEKPLSGYRSYAYLVLNGPADRPDAFGREAAAGGSEPVDRAAGSRTVVKPVGEGLEAGSRLPWEGAGMAAAGRHCSCRAGEAAVA